MEKEKRAIETGETYLGIEFGSTRIKAVLIDDEHSVIASGSHNWENRLDNGIWTYSLDDIHAGLKDSYAQLKKDVKEKYGIIPAKTSGIGISAMMHGYMAFDEEGRLLAPFRTWRNTITGEAAHELTELFGFNIPQRWSIAHLYQSILNGESHVAEIKYITTLAGYIHWLLTGKKVLGIGDASGMFPIDSAALDYNGKMLEQFDQKIAAKNYPWTIEEILPGVLCAGDNAGALTKEGALLLDDDGSLQPGIPMCPPEGDAGTGMAATNAVKQRTGNVSAGTSIFAMVVLEKPLSKVYPEIDMVTTPSGEAVAMVHCNNCLGDVDAWVGLLGDAARLLGAEFDTNTLYEKLYSQALTGDASCGGLLSYNYISGEHVTGFEEGRPLFVRQAGAQLKLPEFMRTHLYSSCSSLKLGVQILTEKEGVALDAITGHGGFFKQAYAGQRIMSSVLNAPVTVMETAGEGGPWGMAVLARYMKKGAGTKLCDYLENQVFKNAVRSTVQPDKKDVEGFAEFIGKYRQSLPVERAAVDTFK